MDENIKNENEASENVGKTEEVKAFSQETPIQPPVPPVQPVQPPVQPQYNQPPVQGQPFYQSVPLKPAENGKGFSIASLVLGICSIVFCCAWYIGIICAVLAIVFAFVYNSKNGKFNGMAIAGLVCGGVGAFIAVIAIIIIAVAGSSYMDIMNDLSNRRYY